MTDQKSSEDAVRVTDDEASPIGPVDGPQTDGGSVQRARRRSTWVRPTLTVLLLTAVGIAVALIRPVYYETSARSFVGLAPESATEGDPFAGSQFVLQRMDSYASLATSPQVLSAALEDAGIDEDTRELADRVTATATPDTVLLTVTVRDRDAERSAVLADAVSAAQGRAVEELEGGGGDAAGSPVRVTTVDVGTDPAGASRLGRVLAYGLFGLGAGLVVVTAVAAVRRARGPRR